MLDREQYGVLQKALDVIADAASSQSDKLSAHLHLNKMKGSNLVVVFEAASRLCIEKGQHYRVFGYKTLSEVVKTRWDECSVDRRDELMSFAVQTVTKVGRTSPKSIVLCNAVARLLGALLAKQSMEQLRRHWKILFDFASEGPSQLDLVCHIACFLCGEVKSASTGRGAEYEALKNDLGAICPELLKAFSKCAEASYTMAVSTKADGDSSLKEELLKSLDGVLKVYACWMDLVPLFALKDAKVLYVCSGLAPVPRLAGRIIGILDKILRRENLCDADVEFGLDAGDLAHKYLEKFHGMRRSKTLDLNSDNNFDRLLGIATAVCSFAFNYMERMQGGVDRIHKILAQALSIFKFGSMEIAVVSLPLWERVLAYPRPSRLSNQTNIAIKKAVGQFSNDLSTCLFGLYEHMETTNGKDDNLHAYSSLDDFKQRHSASLGSCIANLACLYPTQVGTYLKETTQQALVACSDISSNNMQRISLMKRLAIGLKPVSEGKGGEIGVIKRLLVAVLENLLKIDVGTDMELVYWLGKSLQSCSKAVKLDRDLCASLVPRILDILCRLPMVTSGFGLPSVDAKKYRAYTTVQMTLCTTIREAVVQSPTALLPSLMGFRKKVDDAKRKNLISITEYIMLLEVAAITAQQGGPEVRNQTLEWCIKPIFLSWKESQCFNYKDNAFAQQYVAIEAQNPDGSLQMGGREHRWQLYHEILLLSKVFAWGVRPKRVSPGSRQPATTASNAKQLDLDLVHFVAKIFLCVFSISERAKSSQWLDKLLQMGVEDANAFAYGSGGHTKRSELEEAINIAGREVQSCRIWLRAIFELCGQILGTIGNVVPSFWTHRQLSAALPRLIAEKAGALNIRYSSILIEQVFNPWMKFCPSWNRMQWLYPIVAEAIPKVHGEVMEGWGILANLHDVSKKHATAELEEIAYQGLLQEQSEYFAACLENISTSHVEESSRRKIKAVLEDLVEKDQLKCRELLAYAVDLLRLHNWSLVEPLVSFCRSCVRLCSKANGLAVIAQKEVFPTALKLLCEPSMESVADLLMHLVTEIIARFLGESRTVQDWLKQLPGVTQMNCDALIRQLMKESSAQQKITASKFLRDVSGHVLLALSESKRRKKSQN